MTDRAGLFALEGRTALVTGARAGIGRATSLALADAGADLVLWGHQDDLESVAAEVAAALGAPLDAFVVRKLGVPGHEELAMGAIASGGVVVLNAGRTQSDYRLVDAMASTMRAVFSNIFLVDVPEFTNTIVYGTSEQTSLADVQRNLALAREPLVKEVARSALTQGNLRVSEYHSQVYTDDLAPVERLIDSIIFSYATGQER